MQPRALFYGKRNPLYTPSQETVDKICFVTAASSNTPYFELAIQLCESIRSTKYYHNIAIKILDCGLNTKDRHFLIKNFDVEIKDPGYDIDVKRIQFKSNKNIPKSAFKAELARANMHKHFPGYDYYMWMDIDNWVQDERIFDEMLYWAVKQGGAAGPNINYIYQKSFNPYKSNILADGEYETYLEGKQQLSISFFCAHTDLLQHMSDHLARVKTFKWDQVVLIWNLAFHKLVPNGQLIKNIHANCIEVEYYGQFQRNNFLIGPNNKKFQLTSVTGGVKKLPPMLLFSKRSLSEYHLAIEVSKDLANRDPLVAEELAHYYSETFGWVKGSPYYRTYPF